MVVRGISHKHRCGSGVRWTYFSASIARPTLTAVFSTELCMCVLVQSVHDRHLSRWLLLHTTGGVVVGCVLLLLLHRTAVE
jgi:hypothetical protein